MSGIPYRKLAEMHGVSTSTVSRRVNDYLKGLPLNADVTREYCSKFCGILVIDGKYIKVKGYSKRLALIWGNDYLSHDIPHFKLSPSENYHSSLSYFQSLRLLNYPLRCLVSDDNVSFKLAALKVYPKTVIQTCTNHFKENIRRSLGTRSNQTYQPFVKELEELFKKKRSEPEFTRLAQKIYYQWKDDRLTQSIMLDLAKRKDELIGYTKVPLAPYTTNLIEAYNSHLQGRLKALKSFSSFYYAQRWLNGYILKRRLTKFTDCRKKFKNLNGTSSLEQTLKANVSLPKFFH